MAEDNRGWYGDSEGHAKAGEQGGRKMAEERDSKFFEDIGREGGENQGKENNPGNFANDPEKAKRAGEQGGRNSRRS